MTRTLIFSLLMSFHSFAYSQASNQLYQASIGNHSTIFVSVLDQKFTKIKTIYYYESGSETISADLENDSIKIERDGAEKQLSSADGEDYIAALKGLRDLVAYTAGPQRFGWGVDGKKALNPRLNEAIKQIDLKLEDGFEANTNCQLVAPNVTAEPWYVSGGVYGDLGNYKSLVTHVWVREGYEMILSNLPNLETAGSTQATVRGEKSLYTQLDVVDPTPEMSKHATVTQGTAYSLAGSVWQGQLESFICRPYFF